MSVNIIEPIKNFLKEFNTTDEFNAFYSLHKEELDKLTTHKLNKMYYVKGYRITKIKGVLMLKRWDNNKNEQEEKIKEEINNVSTRQKEVDEYVRNDLSKKVETLSASQQPTCLFAQLGLQVPLSPNILYHSELREEIPSWLGQNL